MPPYPLFYIFLSSIYLPILSSIPPYPQLYTILVLVLYLPILSSIPPYPQFYSSSSLIIYLPILSSIPPYPQFYTILVLVLYLPILSYLTPDFVQSLFQFSKPSSAGNPGCYRETETSCLGSFRLIFLVNQRQHGADGSGTKPPLPPSLLASFCNFTCQVIAVTWARNFPRIEE